MIKTKERKKPVRPHWKPMYLQVSEERDRLEVEVRESRETVSQCRDLERQAETLLDRVATMELGSLKGRLMVACEENNFLRVTVSELTATLKATVKVQD